MCRHILLPTTIFGWIAQELWVLQILRNRLQGDIKFKPKSSKKKCKKRKGCALKFKLSGTDASKAKVSFCRTIDGVLNVCKKAKAKKSLWVAKVTAGKWVCVAVVGEMKTVSDPVTIK